MPLALIFIGIVSIGFLCTFFVHLCRDRRHASSVHVRRVESESANETCWEQKSSTRHEKTVPIDVGQGSEGTAQLGTGTRGVGR
jgi:hypothetical protein